MLPFPSLSGCSPSCSYSSFSLEGREKGPPPFEGCCVLHPSTSWGGGAFLLLWSLSPKNGYCCYSQYSAWIHISKINICSTNTFIGGGGKAAPPRRRMGGQHRPQGECSTPPPQTKEGECTTTEKKRQVEQHHSTEREGKGRTHNERRTALQRSLHFSFFYTWHL